MTNVYSRSGSNQFKVLADMVDTVSDNVYEGSSDDSDNDFTLVRKRQRRNTSGRSNIAPLSAFQNRDLEFDQFSVDEKLSTIFSTLTCNQNKVMQLERKMNTIIKMTQRMECMATVMNSYDNRLKLLEYKSIDNEARARRNNLLFKGIPETRDENCKSIICKFLEEKLGCDELPCIERAHRLGARRDPGRGPRPIIMAFSFYRDTENIMSSANALKNSPFGISRDYPIEINCARQTLWQQFKEARANNPRGQTSIAYPAKLIVNGRVTCDMFPDWNPIMKGSRLDYPIKESATDSSQTFSSQSAPQKVHEAPNLNLSGNMGTPYRANGDSGQECMEAQNYQFDQHISSNTVMDRNNSNANGALLLAECPDLDCESGNRIDKWQITERGKSYIQADVISETPQSMPASDTAQNNNSDLKSKSTETPTVADKCHHEKNSANPVMYVPGVTCRVPSSTVKPCLRK